VIKRVLFAAAAVSAFAAAVMVAVAASAFALYAALTPGMGRAGAAAVIAALAALLAGAIALIVGLRARTPPPSESSLLDRAIAIARDRPFLAAGGALFAGLVALKNPRLAAGLASAFMAGKAAEHPPRRRR